MNEIMKPENQMLDLLKRLRKLPMMKPPSESPLSMPQVSMLNWVARSPGCGVRDIAQGLHVTPPTVSVGVRRLVRDGWLEQKNNPDDRRVRPLFLTDKGQAFVGIIHDHRSNMIKLFLSGLAENEQGQLILLLDRAISALEAAKVKETN